jgi:hypothetical protein
MERWLEKLTLSPWERQPPAAVEDVARIESVLNVCVPGFHKRFLCWSNGGEGPWGDSYLRLLSCEKIIHYHRFYGLGEFMKGYVMVGNDGGSCYFFVRGARVNDDGVYMAMAGAFFEAETQKIYGSFDDFIMNYDVGRF